MLIELVDVAYAKKAPPYARYPDGSKGLLSQTWVHDDERGGHITKVYYVHLEAIIKATGLKRSYSKIA